MDQKRDKTLGGRPDSTKEIVYMQVRCQSATGATLDSRYLQGGYTERSEFDVREGDLYTVHGVCLYETLVLYLLDPQATGLPTWYPAPLFTVTDDRVPAAWHFGHYPEPDYKVRVVLGYDELVRVESHFDALAERDAEAIRIFRARRAESAHSTGSS